MGCDSDLTDINKQVGFIKIIEHNYIIKDRIFNYRYISKVII